MTCPNNCKNGKILLLTSEVDCDHCSGRDTVPKFEMNPGGLKGTFAGTSGLKRINDGPYSLNDLDLGKGAHCKAVIYYQGIERTYTSLTAFEQTLCAYTKFTWLSKSWDSTNFLSEVSGVLDLPNNDRPASLVIHSNDHPEHVIKCLESFYEATK